MHKLNQFAANIQLSFQFIKLELNNIVKNSKNTFNHIINKSQNYSTVDYLIFLKPSISKTNAVRAGR